MLVAAGRSQVSAFGADSLEALGFFLPVVMGSHSFPHLGIGSDRLGSHNAGSNGYFGFEATRPAVRGSSVAASWMSRARMCPILPLTGVISGLPARD